ncbi:dihydropteroate synthase [Candidatus Pelagibacter sp. RS39]|uniref:dihydropteroate synthase n=1 Tax=Candidatus Pelagibacter sp. RS39 TaxID=1977864 RepID=UPI000A161471|nr:dihydropteroate synthase [Candidatus Pelagibacter sp. RS39]ARJ47562.1 dihydropteroate synthase [Candidatus Pelagibacter sp. RS39]
MLRYYTRVCNFYYGNHSKKLVNQKKSIPLNGIKEISFDQIEIITRNSKKKIFINQIKYLPKLIRKKINYDLKKIKSKKKNFSNLDFKKIPNILGVLNLTPDSFSDGGKFNSKKKGINHAVHLINSGANLIDVGGESTRPGSKMIRENLEWQRINKILKLLLKKKIPISLDTRKSKIMSKGINLGVKLINDVSGLDFDSETLNVLKKYKIPFVIQHSQGVPENMQKNPKYKNELLDIYDFFEKKIKLLRSKGIKHDKIILDPGIGFGKNLKHNMSLIRNISIFHSLGFPILVGNSRKRFIKELSGKNDSKFRNGGTIASSIYLMMQGVQILRIHDVNETIQGIKIFKNIINS